MLSRRCGSFVAIIALLLAVRTATAPVQDQRPPAFRGGANYVRVDVYPTLNGAAVGDLRRDDFEILEDGVPQALDAFERIDIRALRTGDTPPGIRTLDASRTLVETTRARVFVIFHDSAHVDGPASRRIRQPLTDFLDRAISSEDLVAVMTPDMSASDVTFARRGESVQPILDRRWPWGQRDELSTQDPDEQRYWSCYPGESRVPQGCESDNGIAADMIDRRRELRVLEALQDLVRSVGDLREERKAILTITNGWRLFQPDSRLARQIGCRVPAAPPTRVDPLTGRPTTGPVALSSPSPNDCDGDRLLLSRINNVDLHRRIIEEANRANVSFYPIDPRGLVPFDEPIARPNGSAFGRLSREISPTDDAARLRARQDALRQLAADTDGQIVVNQNDLTPGLQRIADDLSSYYLLGYYSTGKLDGRFHAIRVRVKRQGVQVRARRGYLAATEAELARTTSVSSSASAPAISPNAVAAAMATLGGSARTVPLRVALTRGTSDRATSLWVSGELGPDLPRSPADVSIIVADQSGATVASARERLPPDARAFRVRLVPGGPIAAGTFVTRVRAQSSDGRWEPVVATEETSVRPDDAAGVLLSRRGPASANRFVPTVDRRFRRNEQLRAEALRRDAADPLPPARLLDRNGRPIAVPIAVIDRTDADGLQWVAADVPLAALATGDYLLEFGQPLSVLSAFSVVP